MTFLVPVVCLACGANIVREISFVRRRSEVFCSKKCQGIARTRAAIVRFWKTTKRTKSGCLEWTARRTAAGYGAACIGGKKAAASAIAWQLTRGPVPKGFCVCHRCDNPACVSPDHLFLGTKMDNWNDMRAKGRHTRLDHAVVDRIRAESGSAAAVAERLGLSPKTVRKYLGVA